MRCCVFLFFEDWVTQRRLSVRPCAGGRPFFSPSRHSVVNVKVLKHVNRGKLTYFRGPESCRRLGDAPRAFIGFFRLFLLCNIFKTPRLISQLRLSRLDWFKESYRCKRPSAARISRLIYLKTHVGVINRGFLILRCFFFYYDTGWTIFALASVTEVCAPADNRLRVVSVLLTWL